MDKVQKHNSFIILPSIPTSPKLFPPPGTATRILYPYLISPLRANSPTADSLTLPFGVSYKVPCYKPHILFLCLGHDKKSYSKVFYDILQQATFHSERLLSPKLTPQLEVHPMRAVRNSLFSTFAAITRKWKPSSLHQNMMH
jgi:hypothetical protein